MRKILLITLFFCLPYLGFSQIGVFENFNQGLPSGWQANAGPGNFMVDDVASCEGNSARVTLNGFFITSAQLVSQNITGESNGTDFTLNFDYKVIDAADESAFPDGWGTAEVQYSSDNGATWTTFGTIDDSNHSVSDACAAAPEFTISAADLPTGSDFKMRWMIEKNTDNFRFYIDNVNATQVLDAAPDCTELNNINDGETDVAVMTSFSWSEPSGLPAGYNVSVGTTSGGTDVVDNFDVGPSLNYTPDDLLEFSTDYYVTVTPYNSVGESEACTEIMFTTEDDPFEGATSITPNEGNFCEEITSSSLNGTSASSFDVSCAGPAVQEVWFEFTATSDKHISTLLNYSGFNAPSQAIYDGETNQEIFCSEEFNNGGDSDVVAMFDLTIGNTYYIRVFSDTASNTDFDICLTTPEFGEDNESCGNAAPFCAPYDDEGNAEPLLFPNGHHYIDTVEAEDGPDYGCLYSQPNPAWYFVQIQEAGNISFNITQNTAFDGEGNPIGEGLDVDFIAYGPFDDPEGQCGDVLNSSVEVDCSYSAAPVENFTITDAEEGEYYLVLITNYNQGAGYISFGQTNFGETGAGSTNCDLVFESTVRGCSGDTVTLTSEFADVHVAFQWSYYDADTDSYIPIDGASNATYETDESGEYLLQSYDSNFLEEREFFTVEFQEEPEVDVPENLGLCDGDTLTLDATAANADSYTELNYQWMLDGTDIDGETSETLDITESGDYSVLIETVISTSTGDPNICESVIDFTVEGGDFIVDLGGDQTFCDADTQTITAEVTEGNAENATYAWSTGETTQSIDVSTSGVYDVTVGIDGCSVTKSVEYIFDESPQVDIDETNIVSCDINSEIIDATPSNFTDAEVTYEWFFNGDLMTDETSAILEPSSYGDYRVVVTPVDSECVYEETISVQERDDLGVEITSSVDLNTTLNYCEDSNIGGSDIPTYETVLTAELINADASEVDYVWYKNGNQMSETSSTITVEYDGEGMYNDEYSVEINIQTCSATSSVVATNVEISPYENAGCKITQGLSPDETPGENDNLDLAFLNDRSGIESLEVFDRNGRSVFSMKNYVNEFDGQNDDGDKLVGGTYFYVIKLKNEDPIFGNEKKGWIYIKRK
ncbi:MAG: gliding motility-associated C-terminal domain-containing protein [Psychroflexus sp.]|nr:gliding motility-associated C-terminal domain-containing protein [Psychroflexus sp.]MDN6309768.1 gliding motility-associated C-terminal domain-containing protein [Psychroflexus sp.]